MNSFKLEGFIGKLVNVIKFKGTQIYIVEHFAEK